MKTLTASLLFVLAFALAGCGSDKEAKVKVNADHPAEIVESEGPTESPTDGATGGDAAEKQTAVVGAVVEVASWNVKVTKVVLNANAALKRANQFNDKPKGQYVLVSFEATYIGNERTADIGSDLTWSYTGSDAQVNQEAAEVTPVEEAGSPTEARKGGTVKGQAVFDIDTSLIHGGTLTVEGYNDEFDTVYADFAIA